jgi:hypothetical protein
MVNCSLASPGFCRGLKQDLDGNGEIVVNDLLMLLSVFATQCE